MSGPTQRDARLFFRSAVLRYDEALVLYKAGFNGGPVYLAGYGIECMLKALVLTASPASTRCEVLSGFRGRKAHDFEWLRREYFERRGATFPADITRRFTFVSNGTTDLRCHPAAGHDSETGDFLSAAKAIIEWGFRESFSASALWRRRGCSFPNRQRTPSCWAARSWPRLRCSVSRSRIHCRLRVFFRAACAFASGSAAAASASQPKASLTPADAVEPSKTPTDGR